MIDPTFLSLDDVLSLHADQLERYGGLPGIRDVGALQAAVETPRTTFDGEYLHANVFAMAAAYASTLLKVRRSSMVTSEPDSTRLWCFLLMNGWNVVDTNRRL